MARKIGILGGTFDPPHLGHLTISETCRQHHNLAEVWLIPTDRPPHKKAPLIEGRHRANMLRALVRGLGPFKVNTIELRRSGRSYTLETISALKQRFPDEVFYFIIGSDQIDKLHTWFRVDELQKLVTFIVVPRPGWDLSQIAECRKLFSPASWKRLQRHVTPVPQMDISSTMIRKKIKAGKPVFHLTGRAVENYILKRGLYL
ncbi:nicotinate (nicotinamide) nucleotide adenylyltransferase [Planctomycetota bacterium]